MGKQEREERRKQRAAWKARQGKLPFKRTRGLGLRLMFYFILFGLILGAQIYLFTAIFDMRSLIRDLGGVIRSDLHRLKEDGPEPETGARAKTRDERLHDDLHRLRQKFPSSKEGFEIFIYTRRGPGPWMEMTGGVDNQSMARLADVDLSRRLEALSTREDRADGLHGNGFTEGMVVIPSSGGTNLYGARVVLHQQAIWDRLRGDRDLLIGYGVLVVAFGIILGGLFSRVLTGPLGELSEAALRFAQGDYAYRNRVRRRDELGFLGNTLNYMAEKVDAHIQEIEYKSRTMEAMNRIDKTVLGMLFDPGVVDRVAEIVAGFLGRGVVALIFPDGKAGVYRLSIFHGGAAASRGFAAGPVAWGDLPGGESLSKRGFEEFRLGDGKNLPPELKPFVPNPGGTLLHAPLTGSTGYQGSCMVLDGEKDGFTHGEKEAIRMLADQVGVAIQNARVYREKEDLLLEILLSLTRAIDAKSRWTGGHSGRVAAFAVALGRRAGLSEADLENLKMAGHLHDIGKLGTPEAILDKPGRLTDEEYAVIQKHPEDGARIVGPVDAGARLVPGILHHHERWDGGGYPAKLQGEAIPLTARILCIADVWDAISADRPYRAGMPVEKAMAFMTENRGRMFDPALLDLFLKEIS